jgi:mannonate dehydratase
LKKSAVETTEGDIYKVVDEYSREGRVAHIHIRNVRGEVPHYRETFIDEGDIDMPRVIRILRSSGFDGMLIPDHTPKMSCAAPWHTGMAYALGYLKGLMA